MSARNRPILVTGAAGMLGRAVTQAAEVRDVPVLGADQSDLDVTDLRLVRDVFQRVRPGAVLNLAAYTAVDRAETETATAMAVNRDGAANVAAASLEVGARMVHVSTDYVFDGRARQPYRPTDEPNPINQYGRTKWLGEQSVSTALDDHLIVRTSWVFAPWGNNFVRTIAQLAQGDEPLRVVADQCGRPTSALDLAQVLLDLAWRNDVRGTLHFANSGSTTWHGLAQAIVEMLEQSGNFARPEVIPISTADLPRPAPRPAYSVLDTEAFTAVTGIVPRAWRTALSETLATLE